ncbi:5-dehydro-4-deoxy-D-glucuronate isomerase [Flammeovirga kamogawensis]|uniref:4-deoxy-L-threo-5-hexosulose-uronate ketol-isomerase n=1 Tax=Flammeovirga kamogawensis TaxID=373891 RepID=A0ABX8H4L9_9BACT|nr:5-dehydro-4-deoxy-D-glucuronate isomerase [Flammeovirga kamogawensis]MBB6461885.1 4-deoxy-L-threo-5-hexosulose-uronate ketol-isomerase [Flammeovirga kamogawensis]QWG10502.1 5-dehydro-4-deoxy-D-glucuronate isomerase [Flammeovirga kamogawensis]TRX63612.1 5-dehydro-4-deoxy-D-glucuronate isomerase [Flammeovirga kamogawensis]
MKYESRYSTHPQDVKTYDTDRLREQFLIPQVFEANEILLTYTHEDRYIAGGAFPISKALTLETIDPLKANFFLERRELGIINIGGTGIVSVNGEDYTIDFKEALYIGRGNESVVFKSVDSNNPAKFYINSAPAHCAYPTKKVTKNEAEIVELGALETANHRIINKLIVNSVVETCQLQMGMTELKSGSVWNTMPGHVHDRRMEVYLYFEVPQEQAVCHFMGQPDQSRHIWMHNEQAVISPAWSMHSGSGTSNYTFIWGMAGENLDYGDMDTFKITDLK